MNDKEKILVQQEKTRGGFTNTWWNSWYY